MRRHTGLVAALEEEAIVAPTPGEEAVVIPEGAETLETDLLEVADTAAEGEEQEAQVEEAVETAEALESIAVALESCAANGGLTREAAGALDIAVTHMYSRVGISKKAVTALESFGGTSSRVGATRVAMEDIKEQAKKIWQAIIDGIKRAIAWVKDHFLKVFGAAEKLQKRAEKIKDAAGNLSGKAENAQIENSGLVKALAVGGKAENVEQGLKALADLSKEVLATKAAAQIGEFEKTLEGFEVTKEKLAAIEVKAVQGDKTDVYGEAGKNMTFVRGKELPGGVALVTRGPASDLKGVEAVEAFGKTASMIKPFDPKAKEVSGDKLKTLSGSEVETIADTVFAIGSEIQSFRKTQGKLEEALNKLVKQAQKASAEADKGDDAELKQGAAAVRKAYAGLAGCLVSGYKSVSEAGLKSGKAALDYCELSLKQYK